MKHKFTILLCAAAMIVLILGSKTAAAAVYDSIQLCIQTVIPSLFPFFVLSGMITTGLSNYRIPVLAKLLGIPDGWEGVFLLGSVGGYPVGAQCVAQGYRSGTLKKQDAERMIAFCTNCGPSFLFGIVGSSFDSIFQPAAVMVIGILSAMMVGALHARAASAPAPRSSVSPLTLPQAVAQALRSMASVCAWVILARTLVAFLDRWLLWLVSKEARLILVGLLELTQGCLLLPACRDESLRFCAACALTSFGGLCVALQVNALCSAAKLSVRQYLPQKLLQCLFSLALALVYLLLPGSQIVKMLLLILISLIVCFFIKKGVEIPRKLVYNKLNKGGM